MTFAPQPDTEPTAKPWLRRQLRVTIGLGILALILLLLFVPPFISISRYKNHIAQLVSSTLGRPVRLSSVELRLLPRPGFVLSDLTVEEDPAFGSEPVLHASTVTASIRLFSLWRGRLALDRISVDEASVNLIRSPEGRWNIDSLFRTAAPTAKANAGVPTDRSSSVGWNSAARQPQPYMEASSSRINVKFGEEKLPYSLTSTDASLWHEDDGWHIRLRGQPTRTDLPLDQADTGVVRLEAVLRPASQLSRMPLHIDMDWREAQLGQLSRLIFGSDEDWRGDLTGELHADGTADSARITTRLRATGVHRAEFEPATALDFDANCNFLYRYAARSIEKIQCDSPVGNGRLRLTGNLSAAPGNQQLTLELDHVPAQAPLDLLRTLRGNLDQSLTAEGALTGKMTYAPAAGPLRVKRPARIPNSIQGSFTAQGIRITGDGLSTPIQVANFLLEPTSTEPNQPAALSASLSVPAGASSPLAITAQLAQQGFDLAVRGPASLSRLRELARSAGISHVDALSQLSGEPAVLNLRIEGPWLAPTAAAAPVVTSDEGSKKISGTVAFHNTVWKSDFLASPVQIASATLRLENGLANWDGIAFAYGPAANRVQGTATLQAPLPCTQLQPCVPQFTVRFAALDANSLQAALLGAHEQDTLISSLIDRFRPAAQPLWPDAEGTVQAETLTAGPFTFTGATAQLKIGPNQATVTDFKAHTLGGTVQGAGSVETPGGLQDAKPQYFIRGSFLGVKPQQAGRLIGQEWSGGPITGSGFLNFTGFTTDDFASSAQGSISFDWPNGRVAQADSPLLKAFSLWSGSAPISKSSIHLDGTALRHGARTTKVEGSLTFGPEPELALTTPRR
jgi:hypothetical protein